MINDYDLATINQHKYHVILIRFRIGFLWMVSLNRKVEYVLLVTSLMKR